MTALVVGDGSHLKEVTKFIQRVNERNDFDLAWRWYPDTSNEPEIEVYEEADRHTLCIAKPADLITTMKRYMGEWDLEDPDDQSTIRHSSPHRR